MTTVDTAKWRRIAKLKLATCRLWSKSPNFLLAIFPAIRYVLCMYTVCNFFMTNDHTLLLLFMCDVPMKVTWTVKLHFSKFATLIRCYKMKFISPRLTLSELHEILNFLMSFRQNINFLNHVNRPWYTVKHLTPDAPQIWTLGFATNTYKCV